MTRILYTESLIVRLRYTSTISLFGKVQDARENRAFPLLSGSVVKLKSHFFPGQMNPNVPKIGSKLYYLGFFSHFWHYKATASKKSCDD